MSKKTKRSTEATVIGLQQHTHAERTKLLKKTIVPMLRRELGNNLIAIAADGSYARDEDKAYSDLELMVFVRRSSHLPRGFSKIHDGMLVEGLFVTEREYHEMVHEPNPHWYIAGSDRLTPILNSRFIKKVQQYRTKNLDQKCDRLALDMLSEMQETFGKLFNAIGAKNRANLFPIISDVIMIVFKLMALINRKPYTSLNSMVSEAKRFKVKPKGFEEFYDVVARGKYSNLRKLEEYAWQVFVGIENIFKGKVIRNIYDDDLTTIRKKPPCNSSHLERGHPVPNSSHLERGHPIPNSSPLEGEHTISQFSPREGEQPTSNSSPLEGEDKGGGYQPPWSTQSN